MSRQNDALRTAKKTLRDQIRTAIREMTPDERARQSAAICDKIASLPEWQRAGQILAYMAMGDEVDLAPLLERARREGKSIYLPRIERDEIRFCGWDGGPGDLTPHPFGMLEPAPPVNEGETDYTIRHVDPTRPALCLCPGRAFDRSGRRLGRGKGYYDHFIRSVRAARSKRVATWSEPDPAASRAAEGGDAGDAPVQTEQLVFAAVCFDVQLVEAVPTGPGDERVDLVVTNGQTVRTS